MGPGGPGPLPRDDATRDVLRPPEASPAASAGPPRRPELVPGAREDPGGAEVLPRPGALRPGARDGMARSPGPAPGPLGLLGRPSAPELAGRGGPGQCSGAGRCAPARM